MTTQHGSGHLEIEKSKIILGNDHSGKHNRQFFKDKLMLLEVYPEQESVDD